ncbi:DUF2247 family protein [Bacillus halotolerans]|uniref:DUF2247 family protein n=1 Tax=Bacillus halotolerans TaxID=260554 RepID=UPI0033058AB7
MYTVEIIKKNEFECNWITLFIGRKFKLISSQEVTNYAVNHLENNPNIKNENILELAWEQTEEKVDSLLEQIVSDGSSEVMNREYHKWLYSVLKDIYINSSDDTVFSDIENIFFMFNSPEHMHNFFRTVSDAFYYPSDSEYTVKELLKEFLETEKQIILN